MRKSLIFLAAIIFLGIAVVFYFSYTNTIEKANIENMKAEINSLFENDSYAEAFNFFNSQEEKYQAVLNVEIDKYTNQLCEDAMISLSSDELKKYQEAGGAFSQVIDTIEAVDKINQELTASAQKYSDAVISYQNREFDAAKLGFKDVILDDENYSEAQEYLKEIYSREDSWNSSQSQKAYLLNSCAFDGEYAYVPFVLYGVDGIYKISSAGEAVDFFPLSLEKSQLHISSVNVVGEYLYFIAGEKVGSGYSIRNPYCVYEMKKDGSGLALVMEGNFVDLFIKDQTIYAISREFGLVKYDKNFENREVICDKNVAEFNFSDAGMYYTVQGDMTHDSDNTAYLYDGTSSVEIDKNEYLHYYQFEDIYIKQWQSSSSKELLTYGQDSEETQVKNHDIFKVYGLLEGNIIYSYSGEVGQEVLRAYNIEKDENVNLPVRDGLADFEILSVLYEENKLIVQKQDRLFLCNVYGQNMVEVPGLAIYKDAAEANEKVIRHISDEDIYTGAEDTEVISVIKDKQFWLYKDNELHIALERRYIDEYDTNVYVTHIFTNNYNLLTTGNGVTGSLSSSRTFKASSISSKYNAIYAQSTDAFYYSINSGKGIIVRQGKLLRDTIKDDMIAIFSDGSMEVYRHGDEISGEKLIEMGATTAFAFGPILVEDYNVINECAFEKLVGRNPRSAIGYVEEGHYVLVACDGRNYLVSRGLTMIQLARVFEDEGCSLAYNLDGGLTTTVMFMGNYITQRPEKKPSSEQHIHRSIAEIFYVGSYDLPGTDLKDYVVDYTAFIEKFK